MGNMSNINKAKQGPTPGKILRAVIKEISIVDSPANGRPFLLIKNIEGIAGNDMKITPSKAIISQLQDCGVDVEKLADKAEAVEKGETDTFTKFEKSAYSLFSAMVQFEQAVESANDDELIGKANKPVQRPQLLGFLKELADNVVTLLRRAKFLPDGDSDVTISFADSGASGSDETKGKKKETAMKVEEIQELVKGLTAGIAEAVTAAVTTAMATQQPVEKSADAQATQELSADEKIAELEKSILAEEQAIKATETKVAESVAKATDPLNLKIVELEQKLENLRKTRLGGNASNDEAASSGVSQDELLKAAERLVLGGGNVIGAAASEFRERNYKG